jgi:hypothetical protein
MMEDFTTSLYDDLTGLRKQNAEAYQDMSALFEKAKQSADDWKDKVNEKFEAVSTDLKVSQARQWQHEYHLYERQSTEDAVKSVLLGTTDAARVVHSLISTILQSNAELAAEQERAITASSQFLKLSIGKISTLVASNEAKVAHIDKAMVCRTPLPGDFADMLRYKS